MLPAIERHATREEYQLVHELRLERIGLLTGSRHDGGQALKAAGLRIEKGRALLLHLTPLESLRPFFRMPFNRATDQLPRPLGDDPAGRYQVVTANTLYAAPGFGAQTSFTALLRQRVFEAMWLPALCRVGPPQVIAALQTWLDWLVTLGAKGPVAVVLSAIDQDDGHQLLFEELLQQPVVTGLTDFSAALSHAGVSDRPHRAEAPPDGPPRTPPGPPPAPA